MDSEKRIALMVHSPNPNLKSELNFSVSPCLDLEIVKSKDFFLKNQTLSPNLEFELQVRTLTLIFQAKLWAQSFLNSMLFY